MTIMMNSRMLSRVGDLFRSSFLIYAVSSLPAELRSAALQEANSYAILRPRHDTTAPAAEKRTATQHYAIYRVGLGSTAGMTVGIHFMLWNVDFL